MPEIDQLSIQIESNSQKAQDAIDGLISSLENLNSQLGLKNGTKLTTLLNSLARSANAFSVAINGVGSQGFEQTSKGAEKAAHSMQRANEQAESYSKACSKISESYALIGSTKDIEKLFAKDLGKITNLNDYVAPKPEPVLALPEFEKMLPAVVNTKDALSGMYSSLEDIISTRPQLDAVTNNFAEWQRSLSETPLALPMFDKMLPAVVNVEKMLPAVVQTQSATDRLSLSLEDVVNDGAKLDAVTQAFYNWKAQVLDTAKAMEQVGASYEKWIIPPQGASPSFNRESVGWVSDIIPKESADYVYKLEDNLKGTELAIREVQTTALALTSQFDNVNKYMAECRDTAEKFSEEISTTAEENVVEKTAESAKRAVSAIEEALVDARKFKEVINGMESGKQPFDQDSYNNAIVGYKKATDIVKNYKNELLGIKSKDAKKDTSFMADVVERSVALGDALEKVAQKFDMVAEKGISMFKLLITPFKWATSEYTEKFKHMAETVQNFQKNFKAHMKKISDFWKKTMRTFTFMVVRKAITEIIKEIGNAVQSLAMYSNAMGTAFNTDLSNMVADFQYLGRSIVSVFAPLLNYIVPIIDTITSKIATLLSYIGMLFSALGGGTSFTKAKRNVANYAESLDKASKSAKNLTMGIDELNILSEQSGGGGAKPYDGWEDAWEEVEIPKWVLDLSDWFKDLWKKFFDPLKTAWERAKQYLIDGFKTMIDALRRMFGHIIDDFLTMWNQEKTIRMFEQLLKIFGDLFRVVRNLANQFDKAWEKGKVGLKIFENLRDIFAIIVDHVRNVSYYMIGWAKEIDFSPMLTAFEKLTRRLKPLADFIGGVFEDIMIHGVLKYIEFMINDAIPHLMETITKIADAFNFPRLRERLLPVWQAFEEMFENIHTGMTNAIGNLGTEIAHFVNSDEFAKFLERIAEVTKVLTAERVEKVLTGIGEGIISIAKAVVRFANSDLFINFINAVGKWIDKKSTKDIAKVLEKLSTVIIGFKFASFTASKLAGFFQFFTVITALKNLKDIAANMGAVSKEITGLGKATSTVKITSYAEGFKKLGENLYLLPTKIGELGSKFLDLHNHIGLVTKTLGALFVGFEEFKFVSKYVEDIALAINGDGNKSLSGSILKLLGTLAVAGTAFTALLGVPGGLIAAGCVAAVGAIKGIQNAVDQLNFDVLNEAITTGGDTTLGQAMDWYEQATSLVTEQTKKWTDESRNLTQASDDIQEYIKTIGEMSSVLSESKDATVLLVDALAGKYNDLKTSIDSYIDESTKALISNLLAQKSFLEAQGFNVTQMIIDATQVAEENKKAVDESVDAVLKASEKYDKAVEQFGYGSKEAEEAYKELEKATDKAASATEKFKKKIDEVKTDELVSEIKELGDSLDLSAYAGNPEGAINAVQENLEKLTSTYHQKLSELKKARDDDIKAIQENTLWNDETKAAEIAGVQQTFAEMSDSLSTETGKVFDLYQNTILEKTESVAAVAAKTWEEQGGKIWGYDTKSDYIHEQVNNFVKKMLGEEGLEGSINKLYSELPGKVNQNVVTAMQSMLDDAWNAYHDAMYGVYTEEKANQYDMLQSILDQTNNLDYDTPASTFAENSWSKLMSYARGTNYDEYGKVVIGGAAKSVTDTKQDFEDAMRLVSGEGAMAFTDEHKKEIQPLADAMSEFGLTSADNFDTSFLSGVRETDLAKKLEEETKTWGEGTVTGYNTGIDENIETTKPFIYKWFKDINTWIHDNTDLPFGSPNKKTKEYGEDTVKGFNLGITTAATTSISPVNTWFSYINAAINNGLKTVNQTFATFFSNMLSGNGIDIAGSVTTLFAVITENMVANLTVLGEMLLSTTIPEFILTYLTPCFELFKTWFTEEAMTPWWEESMLFWFSADKWDEEIFTPLSENIHEHWDTFIEWWDTSMTEWWEAYVIKWFEKDLWKVQFENIHEVAKEVFDLIKEAIKKRIEEAQESVEHACEQMSNAIKEVCEAIDSMLQKLSDFEGFEGKITFDFDGKKFAKGGFPEYGSLFIAGEPGAGTEWVGNVGGRTGVVSNGEITGIADAVYATGSTESELLSQLINIGRAMLDKDPIVLGDREIARMANSGQSKLGMSIIT